MDSEEVELVLLAQENNEDAKLELYRKYKPLLDIKSNETLRYLTNKGMDKNDIYQELLLSFELSINNFNPLKDASFCTFVNICLKNRINNLISRHNTIKNKVLNESISLDNVESIDTRTISKNLEEELLDREDAKELMNKLLSSLTKQEYEVFKLREDNISAKEIARRLNKNPKDIYNTIQRIKIKISKILKEK